MMALTYEISARPRPPRPSVEWLDNPTSRGPNISVTHRDSKDGNDLNIEITKLKAAIDTDNDHNNKQMLGNRLQELQGNLAAIQRRNELMNEKAPSVHLLCPKDDERASKLLRPTTGGTVTRMGHCLSRNYHSVAHTFADTSTRESPPSTEQLLPNTSPNGTTPRGL